MMSTGSFFWAIPGASANAVTDLGPLLPADGNGLRLPAGFTSRIVAKSGLVPAPGGTYRWHSAPDGGAVFAMADGGWVYLSNSERSRGRGGVGALRFDANTNIVGAYPVLTGTHRNCAGGATPWGTWLSCEEVERGQVWECDPHGHDKAVSRPALGQFNHEAVAVDPATGQLYLTEDHPQGLLYRFTTDQLSSNGRADLSFGRLEAAEVTNPETGTVIWHQVPDPAATNQPIHIQLQDRTTPFNRGEGICFHDGQIYFTTTGDNRVWSYAPRTRRVRTVYDAADHTDPPLLGVDNITGVPGDGVVIAEDGGRMRIVALTQSGTIATIVQLVGHDQSEITGPAFSPGGRHLYFSSQRGITGKSGSGMTFEVTGAFF